ncbi:hypothetical protein L7F22_062513 [Adiantum nelumboides]|nr:hypothetical protein [Adiantum nelumboides]
MGCLPCFERSETVKTKHRIRACSKRKTYNGDFVPCSMVQEPSTKRMAVKNVSTVPTSSMCLTEKHALRLAQASNSFRFDKRWQLQGSELSGEDCMFSDCFVETCPKTRLVDIMNSCVAEPTIGYMNLAGGILCTIKAQGLLAKKQSSFFYLSLSSGTLFPSTDSSASMTINSCKDAMQRSMDGDAADFERKEEEDGKGKEAPNKASDEKDASNSNTRSSQGRKGEKKDDDGKQNENDRNKETGEKRGEKDGGDEEGKEEEKMEKEAEEEEEEEEEEELDEEKKGRDDAKLDSAVCTVSTSQVEQVFDCSTASDCRSQQSDDMFHGQEGFSSVLMHGCSLATYKCSTPSKSKGLNGDLKTDVDMDTSAYSASHLPISDGCASCCMHHDSPCLQSVCYDLNVNRQATSEVSRDLYSDVIDSSLQRTSSYGSPCLQPVSDVAGWQTPSDVSKDSYTDGSASHNWQPTIQASPSLPQSGAEASQQTSSSASRDCVSLNQAAQPEKIRLRIKLPKDIATNADLPSAFEDGSGEEVLSKLKEVKDFPSTAKGLLSSGALDGCRVFYHYKGSSSTLTGLVKNGGILCNCKLCRGKVVVNVSSFEKHAGSNARHPSDYIFLENGKSLQEIIKAGCQPNQGKVIGVVRKAANDESYDRTALRSGSVRDVSLYPRKGTVPSSDSSKQDSLYSRSSQKQSSQTRDGSRHKLLFQPGGLPDGTEVAYYVKGQCFLRGTKKGHGICCGCCDEVISCSQFEAHAGWASRRNAYISMYLSNGHSLHEYALTLVVKDQNLAGSDSMRDNDDFCAECGDGGDLVLCDACPKAYHSECVGLVGVPKGDWCCPLCEDQRQHPWKENAKDSGRSLGQINKGKTAERCHRVVKASESTIGGCVFCKNGDFQKSGFGPKTIMLCDQCEREFHVGCMKERGVADLQELPAGEWFCCSDCKHIHNVLEGLVISGPQPVWGGGDLGKQQEAANTGGNLNFQGSEVTWQLLHGRRGNPANGKMLAEAASIFTESFDPIVDATSGRDLISLMVYSRTIRDQDFQGMYCAVLKCRGEVISAAVFRIFGRQFAEMPLVATASASRGQGYFQMLMSCIEGLLRSLQVKFFILPAAEGAEGIWFHKFGFSKLLEGQLQQLGSEVQMMKFQGSSMLFKAIV